MNQTQQPSSFIQMAGGKQLQCQNEHVHKNKNTKEIQTRILTQKHIRYQNR